MTSLAHENLDGADLRDAEFWHVDLTGASLAGAQLDGSRFECVTAAGARLTGVSATNAYWEQVDLTGADLGGADLRRATLRGCRLESARLDGADLTLGSLAHSNCGGATFRATRLHRTNTAGVSLALAEIAAARDFFQCRELVAEALRRELRDEGFEVVQLVGAVEASTWCYADWHRYLGERPGMLERAVEVLGRYPASGAREALRDGWTPGRRQS